MCHIGMKQKLEFSWFRLEMIIKEALEAVERPNKSVYNLTFGLREY